MCCNKEINFNLAVNACSTLKLLRSLAWENSNNKFHNKDVIKEVNPLSFTCWTPQPVISRSIDTLSSQPRLWGQSSRLTVRGTALITKLQVQPFGSTPKIRFQTLTLLYIIWLKARVSRILQSWHWSYNLRIKQNTVLYVSKNRILFRTWTIVLKPLRKPNIIQDVWKTVKIQNKLIYQTVTIPFLINLFGFIILCNNNI